MPNINYPEEELASDENSMEVAIERRRVETEKAIFYRLKKILAKSPAQLNDDERKFLKARVSYLTKAEKEEWDEVLNETTEPQLEELTRKELDAQARELGIDNPEELPNKTEVIEAIRRLQ